jgi:hypothetical protein
MSGAALGNSAQFRRNFDAILTQPTFVKKQPCITDGICRAGFFFARDRFLKNRLGNEA